MGKKASFGEEFSILPVDTLTVRNIWFPVMEKKSYPEANPFALNDKRTFFVSADSYVETPDSKVGYRDILSDSIILLNQLDPFLDRELMNRAVERIGKPLIPTMQGGNNFEVKNWGIESKSDTLVVASHISATKGIYLNYNRGTKGITVNKYELQSVFRHELIHYRDKDKWDNYSKKSKFTYKDHADVYLEQMGYPEFKETSIEFQAQIIGNCILRYWNQAENNNQNYQVLEEGLKKINEFSEQKNLKAKVGIKEVDFYGIPITIAVIITDKKGIKQSFLIKYKNLPTPND